MVASEGSSVKVFVRTRPQSRKEIAEGAQPCIEVNAENAEVVVRGKKNFTFDGAMPTTISQAKVFEMTAMPLLQGLFEGYNATILAYGQTGSGKTYTMGSSDEAGCSDEHNRGVIRRVCDQMFEMIETRKDTTDFTVRMGFYEIYNEEIKDLLATPSNDSPTSLRILETKDGVEVNGLEEKVVTSSSEMEVLLKLGSSSRKTSGTQMNSVSSRSHAICTIFVEKQPKVTESMSAEDAELQRVKAKFHLVDLAGSERAKKTGAVGDQFREGVNINQSLLALGNVISALGDDAKRAAGAHVPYRDSKLTRLLQDSLGGNSRTVLIGCISPADTNLEETYNSLQYVHRARNIKNKPVVNRDANAAKILSLQHQVHHARAHVRALEEQLTGAGMTPVGAPEAAGPDAAAVGGAGGGFGGGSFSGSSVYSTLQKDEEWQRMQAEIVKLSQLSQALMQNLQEAELKCTQQKHENDRGSAAFARFRLRAEAAGVTVDAEEEGEGGVAGTGASGVDSAKQGILEEQITQIKQLSDLVEEARRQGFDVGTGGEGGEGSGDDDSLDGDDSMDLADNADGFDGGADTADMDFQEGAAAMETEGERQRQLGIAEEKERELAATAVAFKKSQAHMTEQMAGIEARLQERTATLEKFTRTKVESEKRAELARLEQEHLARERGLRQQMDRLRAELAKIQKHGSGGGSGGGETAKQQVRALKERERKLSAQLKRVREQKAALERVQRQNARKDAEALKIGAAIERIKAEKVALTRRMAEERKRAREETQRVTHQRDRARKAAQKKDGEMKKMRRDHEAKMQVARRKAAQDAEFRRRMTEKEASRRALQREKAKRNAGTRRAGLRQLQLEQVRARVDVEVRVLLLQRRLDAKIKERSDSSGFSQAQLSRLSGVSGGDALSVEIATLQERLVEVRGAETSSCSLEDLVKGTGGCGGLGRGSAASSTNPKHLAVAMAKQLVAEKLALAEAEEASAAAEKGAARERARAADLQRELEQTIVDYEEFGNAYEAQIAELKAQQEQHQGQDQQDSASGSLLRKWDDELGQAQPEQQQEERATAGAGEAGEGAAVMDTGDDCMDTSDTPAGQALVQAQPEAAPASKALKLSDEIFMSGFSKKLDREGGAKGKGYEPLQAISHSTAQALPHHMRAAAAAGVVAGAGAGAGAGGADAGTTSAVRAATTTASTAAGTATTSGSSDSPRFRAALSRASAADGFGSAVAFNFDDPAPAPAPAPAQAGSSRRAGGGKAGTRHLSMYATGTSRSASASGPRRGSLYARPTQSSQLRHGHHAQENARHAQNSGGGGGGGDGGSSPSGGIGRKRQLQELEKTSCTLTPTKEFKRKNRGNEATRKLREEQRKKQRQMEEAQKQEETKKVEQRRMMQKAKQRSNAAHQQRGRSHARPSGLKPRTSVRGTK